MNDIFVRAKKGELSVVADFVKLTHDEQHRCVTCVAQFGCVDLLQHLIDRYNIDVSAEHALWVAAHDSQFHAVKLLMPLVPPTSGVWESVLRYATVKNNQEWQNIILEFDPVVNVDSCLVVAAREKNKDLLEIYLKRAQNVTAGTVMQMMNNNWWDLVDTTLPLLSSDEANLLLLQSIENRKWSFARHLVPYCDVPSVVKGVKRKRVQSDVQEQLQHLILLHETNSFATPALKRKM